MPKIWVIQVTAMLQNYETTLKKVQNKFRKPKFIIIAHSDWKNINSLNHSIKMARELKKKDADLH